MASLQTPNLLIIIDDSSFDLRINSGIASHTKLFKQIVCFSSAEAALDFLAENINNPEIFPHIIFLDIQMPEMDGIRATELIRAMQVPQPQIVALTANAMNEDKKRCLDAGMDGFLPKPVQLDEIKQVLAESFKKAVQTDFLS